MARNTRRSLERRLKEDYKVDLIDFAGSVLRDGQFVCNGNDGKGIIHKPSTSEIMKLWSDLLPYVYPKLRTVDPEDMARAVQALFMNIPQRGADTSGQQPDEDS